MLGAVTGNRDAALTALELDLADWGFTYGVAWARARERAPGEADEAIAREGLDAAETVFRAYTGEADWTQRVDPHPAGNALERLRREKRLVSPHRCRSGELRTADCRRPTADSDSYGLCAAPHITPSGARTPSPSTPCSGTSSARAWARTG